MGKIRKVDIIGGQMTFGQRIELGRIFTDLRTTQADKFRMTMECIHPGFKPSYTVWELAYFEEILKGIQHWIKREKNELHYKPSAEEISAGIELLTLRVGEMGTITALAEKFSQDPDTILTWKYAKVFNILFNNLQSYLYKDRLEKQLAKKREMESKQRRGRR